MSSDFSAAPPSSSLKPRGKNDGVLQVWEAEFKDGPPLEREAFLGQWRSAVRDFSKLLTVEFQIIGIRADATLPSGGSTAATVHTQVRYEFVGVGNGFHREQRIGQLGLEWELGTGSAVRLKKWLHLNEARSRSSTPIFEDRAAEIFGSCASYHAQFLPGVDYWRTVLDGASGIDIYGHNGVAVGDIDSDGFDDLSRGNLVRRCARCAGSRVHRDFRGALSRLVMDGVASQAGAGDSGRGGVNRRVQETCTIGV